MEGIGFLGQLLIVRILLRRFKVWRYLDSAGLKLVASLRKVVMPKSKTYQEILIIEKTRVYNCQISLWEGKYLNLALRKPQSYCTYFSLAVLLSKTNRESDQAHYGSDLPPEYNLGQVTAKTSIFVGETDSTAVVADAEHLRDVLPDVIHFEILEDCSHMDFAIAIKAREQIYDKIIQIMADIDQGL